MAKVITIRLSEEEYKKILAFANYEHRPISNFVTTVVLKNIEESYFTDAVEMAQINSDKKLLTKLKAGHTDAKSKRGGFVG